jgi:hypothetical protein
MHFESVSASGGHDIRAEAKETNKSTTSLFGKQRISLATWLSPLVLHGPGMWQICHTSHRPLATSIIMKTGALRYVPWLSSFHLNINLQNNDLVATMKPQNDGKCGTPLPPQPLTDMSTEQMNRPKPIQSMEPDAIQTSPWWKPKNEPKKVRFFSVSFLCIWLIACTPRTTPLPHHNDHAPAPPPKTSAQPQPPERVSQDEESHLYCSLFYSCSYW